MRTLAASFFLQMAAILVTCRLVGMVAKKIGQPQVVGEMTAGVIGKPLFSILVVMAIVTTLMATPLFEWVYGRHLLITVSPGDEPSIGGRN